MTTPLVSAMDTAGPDITHVSTSNSSSVPPPGPLFYIHLAIPGEEPTDPFEVIPVRSTLTAFNVAVKEAMKHRLDKYDAPYLQIWQWEWAALLT